MDALALIFTFLLTQSCVLANGGAKEALEANPKGLESCWTFELQSDMAMGPEMSGARQGDKAP